MYIYIYTDIHILYIYMHTFLLIYDKLCICMNLYEWWLNTAERPLPEVHPVHPLLSCIHLDGMVMDGMVYGGLHVTPDFCCWPYLAYNAMVQKTTVSTVPHVWAVVLCNDVEVTRKHAWLPLPWLVTLKIYPLPCQIPNQLHAFQCISPTNSWIPPDAPRLHRATFFSSWLAVMNFMASWIAGSCCTELPLALAPRRFCWFSLASWTRRNCTKCWIYDGYLYS